MGLFTPVWMAKDLSKLSKAYTAVANISSVEKLNQIIRKAPLNEVKINAMRQLYQTNKSFQMDEAFCIDTLLSLNIDTDRLYSSEAGLGRWYMNSLFCCIKEEQKRMNLVLKNTEFGYKAVGFIRDEAFLVKIIENTQAAEPLRKVAAEKITDEQYLRRIAGNESLPQSARDAVQKEIDRLNEINRRKQKAEALREKQKACGMRGHNMVIVGYLPHGNGGKDALYRCTECGAEEKWPVEWSSADSV